LAAELAGPPVERGLIEARRALEEHVLRHVRDALQRAVEPCARPDSDRDRGERTRRRLEEHRQCAVRQPRRLAQGGSQTSVGARPPPPGKAAPPPPPGRRAPP